jgi:hypothetical protein
LSVTRSLASWPPQLGHRLRRPRPHGIEHAKQNDQRAYLGRKPSSFTREQFAKVRSMLEQEALDVAQLRSPKKPE